MVGDGQNLSKKYLESDSAVMTWGFDYNRRVVKDGNSVIFAVPEELNESLVGRPRGASSSPTLLGIVGSAAAAEQPLNPGPLIKDLSADDPTVRRNARDSLIALGPSAAPSMISALRNAPNDYRLKTGAILSIAEMLRVNEDNRRPISAALSADDISMLVS